MRVFVGYGYNARDAWIEKDVYPILRAGGFSVVDGKDMFGETLSDAVKKRLDQSDIAVGFLTIREGQQAADFSTHAWVYSELTYAHARRIPTLQVRENGVKVTDAILGNAAYIHLDQDDRLACVSSLLTALGKQHLQRIRLDHDGGLGLKLIKWRKNDGFRVTYKVRDELGIESDVLEGRLEAIEERFFLNVHGLPIGASVEVEGRLAGASCFSSTWVKNSGAMPVKIFESGS